MTANAAEQHGRDSHAAAVEVRGECLVASGALDSRVRDAFSGGLGELLKTNAPVVTVDLTHADSISSICVGALVALWIDLRTQGRSMHLQASPAVLRTLDLTGLTSVLMRSPGT